MKRAMEALRAYFDWDRICLNEHVRLKTNGVLFFFAISFISFIILVINVVTFTVNPLFVAAVLWILSLVFGFLELRSTKENHSRIMGVICLCFLAMAVYFVYSGGAEGFSIIWLCSLPLIGYMIFPRKIARIFNISLLVIVILGLMTPLHELLGYSYSAAFRARFPVVMALGSICAALTEVVRAQTQKRLVFTTDTFKETAHRDKLTSVRNRTAFYEDIESLYKTLNLSYAMADIDRFKRINDTYGHEAGDKVLRTLALMLKDNIRSQDHVYRWGGEEFLIVMPNIEEKDFEASLERIRKRVEDHSFIINEEVLEKITISIGGVPQCRGTDSSLCVKTADQNMYKAKSQGRNRVVIGKIGEE